MDQRSFEVKFAPLDKDGFVQAFPLNDKAGILEFFDDFGFVIIENILSKLEIEESINEQWELIEGSRKLEPISRNDPTSWNYWAGLEQLGLLSQALGLRAWQNRVNPNLYEAFSVVLKEEKLWVSVDNWGVLRPTKAVPQCALPPTKFRTHVEFDGEVVDKPNWTTKSRWLHWDLNPFKLDCNDGPSYTFDGDFVSENNGTKITSDKTKVQGLLNLIDCRVQDGGFLTVPGFHKHIKAWGSQDHLKLYKQQHGDEYHFVYVPEDDPMQKQTQKISMRAGSLLIWSGLQPHCNYPNESNRFRMVQYVKMFEAADESIQGVPLRCKMMNKYVPEEAKTELGRKLFGIDKY